MFKKLHQRARVYRGLLNAQRTRKLVPVIANLFLTGKCNAKCKYCYVDMKRQPEREFNEAQWLDLIDQLIARGTRMFSLVGGEPLLSPHIEPVMDHLNKRNVFFVLTSNGIVVPKRMEIVKKAPMVSISLDGKEESHDAVRGKGQFRQAMAGIQAARQYGIPVRISTVISRLNMDQMDYLVDLCSKHHLHITFTPCIDSPEYRMEDTQDLQLNDSELREFFKKLKEVRKKSSRVMNSMESIDYMIQYPAEHGTVVMKNDAYAGYYPQPCPYGRFQFIIEHTGDVYPCGIWWNRDDFKPVNVFDSGLNDALAHANRLNCQYCSFCNLVDWNVLASWKGLAQGLGISWRQTKETE